MPVTYAQMAANTASAVIQTGVGPVTIAYYPSKVTDKRIAEMQVSHDANAFLVEVIKSWDIVEDEETGAMFPISRIDDLGNAFKVQVMEVVTDISPNRIAPQA